MISVRVNAPLPKMMGLSDQPQSFVIEVAASGGETLFSLFKSLGEQYQAFRGITAPEPGNSWQGITIIVDQKMIQGKGNLEIPLSENSKITLILPLSGG